MPAQHSSNVRVVDDASTGVVTMLRAALPAIPGVNALPGVRRSGGELPDLTLKREAVTVERSEVDAYAAVCGFETVDRVPLTYLHMLAFPLHMGVMTDRSFPYPAIGTVHLENEITRRHHVALGDAVDVEVSAQHQRPHAKGTVFDLVTSITSGGTLVWESTSTYLRLGRGDKSATAGTSYADVPASGIEWRVAGDLGRRYAAVSGDHNPIHLYPLTAKAFGFPRQIAHGMWTKARCVAALENRIPEAATVGVAFKKPVLLPGTVAFGSREVEHGYDFSLTSPKSRAPHLLGSVRSL